MRYFRPYSFLGVLCVIALAIPVLRRDQDWVTVYLPAAERLVSSGDIFANGSGFVYPPINALLPLPFLAMSRTPGMLAWHALNMLALGALIVGAWRLAGGPLLEGIRGISWREHAAFWLGLACGISSCFDAITNQQTDILVAALVILGCLALSGQRDLRAALCFGLAAALKCTPLLWAPYLAWRRRWLAAGLVGVAAVGFNFLPDVTHPASDSSSRAVTWASRFLMPMTESKADFGSWTCGIGGNQSVPGLCQRWLIYDTYWNGNELEGKYREGRASPEMLKAVAWSAMFLLLAAAAVFAWRAPAETVAPPGQPATDSLHFGIILILMVLLSPHSSKPHFCTLLFPGFCVARAALVGSRRGLLIVLIAAVACALASNEDLVGEWLYSWSKWYGSLAGCALLLMAGSGYLLWMRGALSVDRATDIRPFARPTGRRAA
ncbi:MAG TPA: glycosyltransferase family 87 protein [Gemmataceae bacterium]|nr:glycosyltransferase family 87 protein [Gemmataceae bacterium]